LHRVQIKADKAAAAARKLEKEKKEAEKAASGKAGNKPAGGMRAHDTMLEPPRLARGS
jgi:hypothetical protein